MPYIVHLLMESSKSGEMADLCEEAIYLVNACSEEDAREAISKHRLAESFSYENAIGGTVTWRLRKVVEVRLIDEDVLRNGGELWSRFLRVDEADRLTEPLGD